MSMPVVGMNEEASSPPRPQRGRSFFQIGDNDFNPEVMAYHENDEGITYSGGDKLTAKSFEDHDMLAEVASSQSLVSALFGVNRKSPVGVEELFSGEDLEYRTPPSSPGSGKSAFSRTQYFSSPERHDAHDDGMLLSSDSPLGSPNGKWPNNLGLTKRLPVSGFMSSITPRVAGYSFAMLLSSCFKVLLPGNVSFDDPGPSSLCFDGIGARVRRMVEHPSSLCTLFQGKRRYVLGDVNPDLTYRLVDLECSELIVHEWKFDHERGLRYVEENPPILVTEKTDEGGAWIHEKGLSFETNLENVSAPFSFDSVIPVTLTDQEAHRFAVHLTYSLEVWASDPTRPKEPWMSHRGIDDAYMDQSGELWPGLKSEIRCSDPVQQRVWQCYFETQINSHEFLSIAIAICSAGGLVRLSSFGCDATSWSRGCVSLKCLLPKEKKPVNRVVNKRAKRMNRILFSKEDQQQQSDEEEEEDDDEEEEEEQQQSDEDEEEEEDDDEEEEEEEDDDEEEEEEQSDEEATLGPLMKKNPNEVVATSADAFAFRNMKERNYLRCEFINNSMYAKLFAKFGASGGKYPVLTGIGKRLCKSDGAYKYGERGAETKEQLSMCLLHEEAHDIRVLTGRFGDNNASIFLSVLSHPFLGVVIPQKEGQTFKDKFVTFGKLQHSKYVVIRNVRFDVPDGRYEMKFQGWYGTSGNLTGEFNLTEDWKEFQTDNDSLRLKYGLNLSESTTKKEFISKVRTYSRSVYVCDGYLIIPRWIKTRLRNHATMRTCVSTRDECTVIHFRINDLDYKSKETCYMVNAPYVGRVITQCDYPSVEGRIQLHPNSSRFVEMDVFPVTSKQKEALLKDKIASTRQFKQDHDLWYYVKNGKLALKVRVSKIQTQAMFRNQWVSLPTPSGREVRVRMRNHVLPFKFETKRKRNETDSASKRQKTESAPHAV